MILVTGASGNVGKEVVRCLQSRHVQFRSGARNPASSDAGNAVRFDFQDPATFGPAVEGCDALFLLRPPAVANTKQTLNRLIDVARQQGVAQVVFLSVAGAADNRIVPHHAVEEHLKAGPAGWTILRPGFFAQNLGDAYRADIVQDHRIYLPAGAGRVAFIDVRDIAEVAASALIDPAPHRGQSYTLTGPEALPFANVATILSDAVGQEIHYAPSSIPGYAYHLFRRGLAPGQILVQTVLHVGLRYGQAETVTAVLPELLGHPSRTVREYVSDHRKLWQTAQGSSQ